MSITTKRLFWVGSVMLFATVLAFLLIYGWLRKDILGVVASPIFIGFGCSFLLAFREAWVALDPPEKK